MQMIQFYVYKTHVHILKSRNYYRFIWQSCRALEPTQIQEFQWVEIETHMADGCWRKTHSSLIDVRCVCRSWEHVFVISTFINSYWNSLHISQWHTQHTHSRDIENRVLLKLIYMMSTGDIIFHQTTIRLCAVSLSPSHSFTQSAACE